MSAFDLSNVLAAAANAASQSNNSGNNYPPVIYPSLGTLTVRLLFNPKSNSIMRLIRRHKLDSGKVDCASQWGLDCPVCKAIETINTMKGMDLWTLKSKTYGIAYAQFVGVSTGYDFGGRKIPQRGDLIVLMFPWSVYIQISELIQKSGDKAGELLTDNEGRVFNIERKVDKSGRTEYRVDIDPFAPTFKSKDSQKDFDAFLTELTDLNETMSPSELPEGHIMKLQAEADNLIAKYIGGESYVPQMPQTVPQQMPPQIPQVPQMTQIPQAPQAVPSQAMPQVPQSAPVSQVSQMPPQAPQMPQTPVAQMPQAPQQVSTLAVASPPVPEVPTAPAQNDGKPACFGNLNLQDKNCLICAHTVECSKKARERK